MHATTRHAMHSSLSSTPLSLLNSFLRREHKLQKLSKNLAGFLSEHLAIPAAERLANVLHRGRLCKLDGHAE
eukprot:1236325-Pleurochrysis_carterae.AAC.2